MKRIFPALFFSILVIIGLAACQPDVPPPQVEAEVVVIQISPAARPAVAAVQTCAAQIEGLDLRVVERFPEEADPGWLIRLGVPEAVGFMAQIATEEVGVVLHPDNPAAALNSAEIRDLFAGQIVDWGDLDGDAGAVRLWALLPGDETRMAFERQVMSGLPLAANAGLVPDPAAMLEVIGADPAAIGIMPVSWLEGSLRVILPGVRLPVLVTGEEIPEGAAADLIACLQGETGQAALRAVYP